MTVIGVLVIITPNLKQRKCPSPGDGISKLYTHNGTLLSNNKEQTTDNTQQRWCISTATDCMIPFTGGP